MDLETKEGEWTISTGKNGRIFISCETENKDISGQFTHDYGLLLYKYQDLKDLGIAILRYEKEKQEKERIVNNL